MLQGEAMRWQDRIFDGAMSALLVGVRNGSCADHCRSSANVIGNAALEVVA